MTTFVFRNDADLDVADYGRYCGLIEAAAPLAADLCGLALPERIVACPVTPGQFVERQVEHSVLLNRLALNTIPGMRDDVAEAMVDRVRTTTRDLVTRFHPTARAPIMWRTPDTVELTFVPDGYERHLRPSGRQLTATFAHGITHLAQVAFRPELAVAPLRCKLLDHMDGLSPEQHRNPAALSEGHARHVERLASEALCGQAVLGALPGDPQPSDLYRQLKADPAAPTNNPAYDKGEAFVAAVIEARGHQLLRLALADDELVPTEADLDDPAQWLTRH
ncbi:hypothetical protein [Kitasatospora sp. NPDC058478]|uniref:hypothetical protein n=1 Tax=unclassified Kitasatospora TaxID=2633591 RepID=UPI003654E782